MSSILTAEDICEIDTFTLEEKIEEIEALSHPEFYQEILRAAKIELLERLQIQEFGRKLVNDQIKIIGEEEIKFPLMVNLKSIKVSNKALEIKKRNEIMMKIKSNLLVTDTYVTVGRAPHSHQYQPMRKKIFTNEKVKHKKYLRKELKDQIQNIEKLSSNIKFSSNISHQRQINKILDNKKTQNVNKQRVEIKGKESICNQKQYLIHETQKQSLIHETQKQPTSSNITTLNELKQKLKKQIQNTKVEYIQNDVYEQMKLMKVIPQNLIDLEHKIGNTIILTEEACDDCLNQSIFDRSSKVFYARKDQRKFERAEEEIHQESNAKLEKQEKELQEFTLIRQNQNKQDYNKSSNIKDQWKIFSNDSDQVIPQFLVHQETQFHSKDLVTNHKDQEKLSSQIKFISQYQTENKLEQGKFANTNYNFKKKQSKNQDLKIHERENYKKSQSVRNIGYNPARYNQINTVGNQRFQKQQQKTNNSQKSIQKTMLTVKSKAGSVFKKQQSNLRFSQMPSNKHYNPSLLNISGLKSSKGVLAKNQMLSSKLNFYTNLKNNSNEVYPYHQKIQSFAKLFPHSKNILQTLKSIESALTEHFEKQIFQKSKSTDYLALNQNQIMFKVISESEKAKKYSHLFNIKIQSFFERGAVMLSRVKHELRCEDEQDIMLYRVVRTKQQVYDIINSSFHRSTNWYELPHGMEMKASWNLLWTWSKPQVDLDSIFYFQKINHFLGNKEIARKDLLKKNIENIKKLGAKMKSYFDIIPETYLLPGENIQFIKKFKEYASKDELNYWILKPVGLSRGRGISLINKLQDIQFSEPIILQRYLRNPLLMDGYKFDMRIYVLVTSMNPLQAFIYKQGFARISTEKYTTDKQQMENLYIHLTNFSIQKNNIHQQQSLEEKLGGCKISLKMLSEKLEEKGIKWSHIEGQIEDIVLKSLVACMNTIAQNQNSFQIFGYDIFIDADLKCWLLQVNSSPSLEKQYTLDEVIKQQLIDDTIELLHPIKYDRQRLLEVVIRRRKQYEGFKSHVNFNNNSTNQLNQDLHYILHGQPLHQYGTSQQQNFTTIAPGLQYQKIIKAIQHYKIDPIQKLLPYS